MTSSARLPCARCSCPLLSHTPNPERTGLAAPTARDADIPLRCRKRDGRSDSGSACGRRTMSARRGGASRDDSGSGPKTGRMNDRSYLSTQPLWSRIRSTAAEVGINAEQCAVVLIRGQRRNENRANARSLAPSLGRKWPRCCPPCRLTRSIHARPKCSKGSILAGSMVYSTTQVITVQG